MCACFVPSLDDSDIRAVAEKHQGDIRATLNDLQSSYSKKLLRHRRRSSDVDEYSSGGDAADRNKNQITLMRKRRQSGRL